MDLRQIANTLPKEILSKGMLVGQPVMVEEGFDEIELDGRRLSIVSTVCLALLIWIGFRSLRWAIISILVVQWSLVVTRGLLYWLAWDLTMVSSMLASIVTVIGVATTMHWMLGYQQAMRQLTVPDSSVPMTGIASAALPEAALRLSMGNLWWPILWACITDAIGFASLAFAEVGPIQDYGCMMALASMVVLLGIFVLIPALALVPLAPKSQARRFGLSYELFQIPGDVQLRGCLLWILRCVIKSPVIVSGVAIGLCIIAAWGSLQLKVETDFIKNFRSDAPLVLAYRAVESELGGAGVWDVVLPAPKVMSQKYLDQVTALEQRLLTLVIPGEQPLRLTKVMSFADADHASRSSRILGNLSIEARLLGMRQTMGNFVDTLVTRPNNGQRFLRIMLRSREQAESEQKELLIAEVQQQVENTVRSKEWKAVMDDNQATAMVSGYYLLLSHLVSSVVEDQWRCFAVATLGIWIAMAIALRSSWLAFLTILPNALPSLCILGWMGWTGTRVNLGAAMIAAVSMGLSVDSSLHYLIRFQRERSQGQNFEDSLIAAQSEIGMAMLLSTFALVLGFGSLAVSNFLPTVVFGTTASISMVGGLLCNLAVLPALLRLFRTRD
jgi:predicted RND superfamily exporter protein